MTMSMPMTFVQTLVTECDHSPYLALLNFWLFQKLKTALMSNRFSDIVNIQVCDSHPEEHSKAGIPGFQQYFYKWKHQLTKCTAMQGDITGTIGAH